MARHKSILAYCKGSGKLRCNTLGVWSGSGKEKRYHAWGQDADTARYYIDCFTFPGQIGLEPFTGGGTTLVVCDQIEKRFSSLERETRRDNQTIRENLTMLVGLLTVDHEDTMVL